MRKPEGMRHADRSEKPDRTEGFQQVVRVVWGSERRVSVKARRRRGVLRGSLSEWVRSAFSSSSHYISSLLATTLGEMLTTTLGGRILFALLEWGGSSPGAVL